MSLANLGGWLLPRAAENGGFGGMQKQIHTER